MRSETRVHPNIALLVASGLILAATVFTIHNTLKDPTVAYAILYLFGITGLAWIYPQTALLLTFAAGPFQNDLSGNFGPLRFSVVEINILVVTVVFILRMAKSRAVLRCGPAAGATLLYIALCIASSIDNWRGSTMVAMVQTVLYMVVTVTLYASFVRDEKEFYRACYAFVAVCVALSCMEFASGTSAILGLNKNGIGSSLAAGTLVAAELWLSAKDVRCKWQIGGAMIIVVAGLTFSLSRGAWLGAAIGLGVILMVRQQVRLLLQMLIVLAPVVMILWNIMPQERKDVVTNFDANGDNVRLRVATIDYCLQLFREHPLTGVGLSLRKDIDATNIFMVSLAEAGIPGLLAFLLIHVQILRMVFFTRRLLPRSDPRFSILVIATALILYKLAHGAVDHYWSRGTISVAWASVGVATGLYYSVRREKQFESRKKIPALPAAERAS